MEFYNRSRVGACRLVPALALLGIMALALAACDSGTTAAPATDATSVPAATAPAGGGSSDLTPTPAASDGGGAVSTSGRVELKEWAVQLSTDTLTAGTAKFDVTNSGKFGHDLVIQDSSGAEVGRTPVFKSDEGAKTLEVTLKTGTYKFFCDVPGHAKQGMTTDVTVK
jgi:uncharacterized cupredoxin-like copper-binding protein